MIVWINIPSNVSKSKKNIYINLSLDFQIHYVSSILKFDQFSPQHISSSSLGTCRQTEDIQVYFPIWCLSNQLQLSKMSMNPSTCSNCWMSLSHNWLENKCFACPIFNSKLIARKTKRLREAEKMVRSSTSKIVYGIKSNENQNKTIKHISLMGLDGSLLTTNKSRHTKKICFQKMKKNCSDTAKM